MNYGADVNARVRKANGTKPTLGFILIIVTKIYVQCFDFCRKPRLCRVKRIYKIMEIPQVMLVFFKHVMMFTENWGVPHKNMTLFYIRACNSARL